MGERPERFDVRLTPEEKMAFRQCAKIDGVSFSTWARIAMRNAAKGTLEEMELPVKFLKQTRLTQ